MPALWSVFVCHLVSLVLLTDYNSGIYSSILHAICNKSVWSTNIQYWDYSWVRKETLHLYQTTFYCCRYSCTGAAAAGRHINVEQNISIATLSIIEIETKTANQFNYGLKFDGFHLHLLVFPFVYQFNSRIVALVSS